MAFMFEKLQVHQKAVDFADQVTTLTEGFPRGYDSWGVATLSGAALARENADSGSYAKSAISA